MNCNPVLKKLGLSATDRVAVVHADDIGMCQSTLSAFFDLLDAGLVSSGSVMVPCPWFPDAAALCRNYSSVDIGVHLTLTSEWDSYRWGPISTRDPASGLIDSEGYFYRDQSMWENPDPQAAYLEMQTQVDRALKAGLDLTHIDCHMFAAIDTRIVRHYVELGFKHRLPVLMLRQRQWVERLSERSISEWEEQGLPVFDHLAWDNFLNQPPEGRLDQAKKMFDELPPGLTYFILHPARDTPEMRAIGNDWQQRVADYKAFLNPELYDHVRNSGIHVIGWRPLREIMQASLQPPTLSA